MFTKVEKLGKGGGGEKHRTKESTETEGSLVKKYFVSVFKFFAIFKLKQILQK